MLWNVKKLQDNLTMHFALDQDGIQVNDDFVIIEKQVPALSSFAVNVFIAVVSNLAKNTLQTPSYTTTLTRVYKPF